MKNEPVDLAMIVDRAKRGLAFHPVHKENLLALFIRGAPTHQTADKIYPAQDDINDIDAPTRSNIVGGGHGRCFGQEDGLYVLIETNLDHGKFSKVSEIVGEPESQQYFSRRFGISKIAKFEAV